MQNICQWAYQFEDWYYIIFVLSLLEWPKSFSFTYNKYYYIAFVIFNSVKLLSLGWKPGQWVASLWISWFNPFLSWVSLTRQYIHFQFINPFFFIEEPGGLHDLKLKYEEPVYNEWREILIKHFSWSNNLFQPTNRWERASKVS